LLFAKPASRTYIHTVTKTLSAKKGTAMAHHTTKRRKKGAALVEYGLLAGLISVVAISAVAGLGSSVQTVFDGTSSTVATEIENATGIALDGPGSGGPSGGGGGGEGPIDPTFIDPTFDQFSVEHTSSAPTDPYNAFLDATIPSAVVDPQGYATYWTTRVTWSITGVSGNQAGFPTPTIDPQTGVVSFGPTPAWPTWCDGPSWPDPTPPDDLYVDTMGQDSQGNRRAIYYLVKFTEVTC
jgi:Flp pilus assembly pilin Flp